MFMADDGHGGDISIPAILISKNDGDKIINYYIEHRDSKEDIKKIRFEIKFDLEKKDNTVNYEIWYTPDIENVYIFLKDFQRYQYILEEYAKINVRFVTYPHFLYDANKNNPYDDCFGAGLYCIRPGKFGITDGTLIIMQSLIQKCIFDYSMKNEKQRYFLNYMTKFYENCIKQEKFNEICSNDVINNVGIPLDEINSCVKNSFVLQSENSYKISKNKILDNEYALRKKYNVNRVPSITINGRLYIGSWRPEFVFEALCASLIKKPRSCYSETIKRQSEGFSNRSMGFIIFFVFGINFMFFIVCKSSIKDKITQKINSLNISRKIDSEVNNYIALKELNK